MRPSGQVRAPQPPLVAEAARARVEDSDYNGRRPMKPAILIGVLCLTTACYSYNPLTTPSPDPGVYVSVTLNDAGSVDLARYLGPSIFLVRGRYLGPSDQGGLLVSVSSVETKRGDGYSWQGRSEEHTSELQSRPHLVCRLLLEKKKKTSKACIFAITEDAREV